MITILCSILTLTYLLSFQLLIQQQKKEVIPFNYQKGLQALTLKDTILAKKLFEQSINQNDFADAYYELAKILYTHKNPALYEKAKILIEKAINRKPENIEYRLLLGKILEKFCRNHAIDSYKEILLIDSTSEISWYNLGRLTALDFYDFNKSFSKAEAIQEQHHFIYDEDRVYEKTFNVIIDTKLLSLNEFSKKDFQYSEYCLKKAIALDSTFYNAYFELGLLYDEANLSDKAIPYLEKYTKFNPLMVKGRLIFGMILYKSGKLTESYQAYQKAFKLMTKEEHYEFVYGSAKNILEPILKNQYNNRFDLDQFIEAYWKINDPVFITTYNERLLEHYARVTYANLKFSVEEINLSGWKSDRGQIYLRYGEPKFRYRQRQTFSLGEWKGKIDVWMYSDMYFRFEDKYGSGEFRTHPPNLRRMRELYNFKLKKPVSYSPGFLTNSFKVPLNIVQFKNLSNDNLSDIYFNYAFLLKGEINTFNNSDYAHGWGLLYFDNSLKKKFDRRGFVSNFKVESISDSVLIMVNICSMTLKPDSGFFSLELQKEKDKEFSINRNILNIKNFSGDSLKISDIVLALNLSKNHCNYSCLKRKNLNILPNPMNCFNSKKKVFLYYELYNVCLDNYNIGEFEQRVSLKKIEYKKSDFDVIGLFKSINDFFLIKPESQEISIISSIQTNERTKPVHYMLDMLNYEAADYVLTISIEDKKSKQTASNSTVLFWRKEAKN